MDIRTVLDWTLLLNVLLAASAVAVVLSLIRLVHDREDLRVALSIVDAKMRVDFSNRGGRPCLVDGVGGFCWDTELDGSVRPEAMLAYFPTSRGAVSMVLAGRPLVHIGRRRIKPEDDYWLLSADQVREDVRVAARTDLPDRYRIVSRGGAFAATDLSQQVRAYIAAALMDGEAGGAT